MSGHGPLLPEGGVEGFCGVLEVGGLGCVAELPAAPVEPVEPVVAAAAPEEAATAPPPARAPATIVAPSILEMRIFAFPSSWVCVISRVMFGAGDRPELWRA